MSLIRLGSAATNRKMAKHSQVRMSAEIASGGVSAQQSGGQFNTPVGTETEKAVERLVRYIPTETVTLFLAAVSFVNAFDHVAWLDALKPYGLIAVFTVLTPLMLLAAAYATFAEAKRANTLPADETFTPPVFDMVASALAFVPWALAVPGLFPESTGPVEAQTELTAELAQVGAAFLAFMTSWFLSLLHRIIGPDG